jgi:hypothetical protein
MAQQKTLCRENLELPFVRESRDRAFVTVFFCRATKKKKTKPPFVFGRHVFFSGPLFHRTCEIFFSLSSTFSPWFTFSPPSLYFGSRMAAEFSIASPISTAGMNEVSFDSVFHHRTWT